MSTRKSGRSRRKHDLYETPAWVITEGLAPHFAVKGHTIAEIACGKGKMALALLEAGAAAVLCFDKVRRPTMDSRLRPSFKRHDFTAGGLDFGRAAVGIITNPPYGEHNTLAVKFIERGLEMLRTGRAAWMALLLPVDFDLAYSRVHLVERCPEYRGCIRLRKRIEWFPRKIDRKTGRLGNGPSEHHAWFIWDCLPRGDGVHPFTLYAPSTGVLI